MKQKNKTRLIQGVSILILLFLFFFLTFRTLNYITHNGKETESTESLPEKIILLDLWGRLYHYKYNKENNLYEFKNDSDKNTKSKIFRLNESIYLWDSKQKSITNYLQDSESFVSEDLSGETVSVAGYKNHIYICTEGSLLVLNEKMKKVGSIELDIGGYGKNAHDIIFYEDIAYLLDNILFPIYILKVDISDPKDPKILTRKTIEGINQHLSNQWLDTVNNQWVITQDEVTQMGWYQSALFFELGEDGSKKIGEQMLFSYNNFFETSEVEESGFVVHSVIDRSPVWAIITKAESTGYFLAKINNEKGKASLGNEILLTEKEGLNLTIIKERNGFIFVVYENELTVVDINKEKPEVILKQSLSNAQKKIMNPSDFIVF